MTEIDSRAVVHPGAELGQGVKVGAFAIIDDHVTIGDNTIIEPHVVIRNHTTIGQSNHFYQFSSIGEDPQYIGYNGEPTTLVIGDRNVIREGVTLNRGVAEHAGSTVIGNDNLLMAYVHVAHDCIIGDHNILANNAALAGHVELDDYVILGGYSLIHQFCKVGSHSITGINTVSYLDIPPFVKASGTEGAKPYGINRTGLLRRDFSKSDISLLKKAYKLLYRSKLSLHDAKSAIAELSAGQDAENDNLQAMLAFLQRSERGIIR